MLFLFMLLREKDQKVLYSFEMLLLSEKLLQKYRPAALMIQIVNIDKSKDASVFLRVGSTQASQAMHGNLFSRGGKQRVAIVCG